MTHKPVFLLLPLLFVTALSAQSDPPKNPEEKTYEMFDLVKPPVFPGGEAALAEYLSANVKYPALARENGIQGTVVLIFNIEKDGSITNIKLVKDIGNGCGKESVRVVEAMPKWTPGEAPDVPIQETAEEIGAEPGKNPAQPVAAKPKQTPEEIKSHPVRVRYTLPVRFKLDAARSDKSAGPTTRQEMWKRVSEAAQKVYQSFAPLTPNTPYSFQNLNDKKLAALLESTLEIKFGKGDLLDVHTLGELSEQCYRIQFAPKFYLQAGFSGRAAKILTHRADFDSNADGTGKIGSLKVPKGIRVVLYSKKNFKGKKLEINAGEEAIEIPDLSSIQPLKGKINNGGKKVNWSMNTQSVKIILPLNFPQVFE